MGKTQKRQAKQSDLKLETENLLTPERPKAIRSGLASAGYLLHYRRTRRLPP